MDTDGINPMNKIKLIAGIILSMLMAACSQVNSDNNSENNIPAEQDSEWLIPSSEIVDGGPGKDGIPSIDNPIFSPASEIDYVQDDRLVIGIKVGNEIKAYPHQVLDWHEIINDQVGEAHLSMTYCPLTGTGIAWNRVIEDEITEFGVSGLLFRNNLIAYDRNTDTHYSQMQIRGVKGPLSGESLKNDYATIQTTWKTWKQMYPDSQVLTRRTGFARFYGGFAYGESYLNDEEYLLFPVKHQNERLPGKTVVHVYLPENVTGDELEVRVFAKEEMREDIEVINEEFAGHSIVAVGSQKDNFIVSFYRNLEDGTLLNFQPVNDRLPIIMKDGEGNEWTVFGEAVNGPRTGEKLQPTKSYNGYWFAIADMFPNACVYPGTGCKGYIEK